MADLNPYEPPQELTPLTIHQRAKRRIGFGLVLLLTPPAMVIAVATSCSVASFAPSDGARWLVVFGGPLAVLCGMMMWAANFRGRKSGDSNRVQSPAGMLFATPVVTAVAMMIGFGLAIVIFVAVNEALGVGVYPGMVAGVTTFWIAPAVALVVMLWLAWRAA
jgi:hypothetical protein